MLDFQKCNDFNKEKRENMSIHFKILIYHFKFLFSIKETMLAQGKQSREWSVQQQERFPSTLDVQSHSLGTLPTLSYERFQKTFTYPPYISS